MMINNPYSFHMTYKYYRNDVSTTNLHQLQFASLTSSPALICIIFALIIICSYDGIKHNWDKCMPP